MSSHSGRYRTKTSDARANTNTARLLDQKNRQRPKWKNPNTNNGMFISRKNSPTGKPLQ
jgi:hypothetical protein